MMLFGENPSSDDDYVDGQRIDQWVCGHRSADVVRSRCGTETTEASRRSPQTTPPSASPTVELRTPARRTPPRSQRKSVLPRLPKSDADLQTELLRGGRVNAIVDGDDDSTSGFVKNPPPLPFRAAGTAERSPQPSPQPRPFRAAGTAERSPQPSPEPRSYSPFSTYEPTSGGGKTLELPDGEGDANVPNVESGRRLLNASPFSPHSHSPPPILPTRLLSTPPPHAPHCGRQSPAPPTTAKPIRVVAPIVGERFSKWNAAADVSIDLDVAGLGVEEVVRCVQLLKVSPHVVDNIRAMTVDGTLILELDESILVNELGCRDFEARKLMAFFKNKWRPKY